MRAKKSSSRSLKEFKKMNTTKTYLLRSPNKVKYLINDRTYIFIIPDSELGEEIPYAYCPGTDEWAWLYDDLVWFKSGLVKDATLI